MSKFIERDIVIGLITCTALWQRCEAIIDPGVLESVDAQRIARWCQSYYKEFKEAPGRQFENLFYEKAKEDRLPPDTVTDFEQTILPSLDEQFEQTGASEKYIIKRARRYFRERRLVLLGEDIQGAVESGKIGEAETLIKQFAKIEESDDVVDLTNADLNVLLEEAFQDAGEQLIQLPGVLGTFMGTQLVRGGFVAFLSPEKRGKSWMLLELAMRAFKQGKKVAFVQAGDMTRSQQLIRMAMYVSHKSPKEHHTGTYFRPVKDCIKNQLDICDKNVRECDFGIFDDMGWDEKELKKQVTFDNLIEAYENNKQYQPCYNCSDFEKKRLGTVFLEQREMKRPLSKKLAEKLMGDIFTGKSNGFKLTTHSNDSLSVPQLNSILDGWRVAGFIPDVIVIDYADLLVGSNQMDYRNQQNKTWKGLRAMSQERDALVITATQTNADAYGRDSLTLKNYSEDKRKYAHVTAMYSLNQDAAGREKQLGILRIGELLLRDDEFDTTKQVTVVQCLREGRPLLTSF